MSILDYLQYDFVIYMIIVIVLVALCASLLGVIIVLKRFSYLGDGLSHVAFGALALASIVNVSNSMYIVLPVTILVSVFLLSSSQNKKINGDAMIAIISVGCLSIGYLLMNLFPTSQSISSDVCTSLFGSTSIPGLNGNDVILTVVLTIIVLLYFIFFYNKLFITTFDEKYSTASGINVKRYNLLLSIIIGIIVTLGMKLVGSLLVSALIVFPCLASSKLFKSFKGVMISSGIFAVITSIIGLLISMVYETPIGASIVAIDLAGFLLFSLIKKFVR